MGDIRNGDVIIDKGGGWLKQSAGISILDGCHRVAVNDKESLPTTPSIAILSPPASYAFYSQYFASMFHFSTPRFV